jgi:hypothetical protein
MLLTIVRTLIYAFQWQNGVERLIGSIRRECLDPVIIFSEKQLRRVLRDYFAYYHGSRTHLGLSKDCPLPRPIEPPGRGAITAAPMVGGLHHRYAPIPASYYQWRGNLDRIWHAIPDAARKKA